MIPPAAIDLDDEVPAVGAKPLRRFWRAAFGFWSGDGVWIPWALIGMLIACVVLQLLVVVDQRMPDIDGIDLIEWLRGQNVTLPTILIHGSVTKQLRTLAQRLGVAAVLEKPLFDSVLVESIRTALASRV